MPPTDRAMLADLARWLLEPRTISSITEHCGIGVPGVYRRLRALEREGYVIYRRRDRTTGELVRQAAGRDGIPVQVAGNTE
jgi:DNA-binding IclR family transcriptional regulator